jgi:diketogulonate reductase-like aldo/keto reductase
MNRHLRVEELSLFLALGSKYKAKTYDQATKEGNDMQTVTLNNGVEMPLLGFGVFQVPDAVQCEQVVSDALTAGYRLIDTAAAYLNEEAVGKAIRKSGISRKELFVTTKLWIQDAGYENTKKAFGISIDKLGLDYLDLYLIHQPYGDYYASWRAMEELYETGKIRAIGVSNFYPERLADICLNAKVIPAVNQVECHPFFQQTEAMKTMKEFGVQIEAWGPFAEGKKDIFQNGILSRIAAKYGKTTAQVILRWNVQRGVIVIPKSVHKERIAENINIWDFKLFTEDMDAIAGMDAGHSEIISHFTADTAKYLNGHKIHD